MKINKLKKAIREAINKVLAEKPYNPYEEEDDDVETLPTTRPTISPDEDDDDLNIGKPIKTPAKAEKEAVNQIMARFNNKSKR
jgi:hypothetical protein